MAFQVYVNDGTKAYSPYATSRGGYLSPTGGIVAWEKDAAQFPTFDAASAHIAERGWENDTSVRPGRITAYVSNVPPLPPRR